MSCGGEVRDFSGKRSDGRGAAKERGRELTDVGCGRVCLLRAGWVSSSFEIFERLRWWE